MKKTYIEFKSDPYYYWLEHDGEKPYTVRKIDKDDKRNYLLEYGEPTHIRITRADNPAIFFDRKIKNICWMPMFKLWGIAWKHLK